MPIPSGYSETELKAYMQQALGPVADALEWSVVANSYDESVTDTLLAYGVTDIADATDITKLRALALVAVWRSAEQAAAGLIDFSVFQDQYKLGAIQDRIAKSLALAESRAAIYDTVYAVQVRKVSYPDDPYQYAPSQDGIG